MITPQHFEILQPLKELRILSTHDLKRLSNYERSNSAFYKVVTRLERDEVLKNFNNPWTNEKYLYLSTKGLRLLGDEKDALPINLDQRFHDAIVTKVALAMRAIPKIHEVFLDSHVPKSFPLMEKTPDILVTGSTSKEIRLAVEIELTQKNKSRLEEIFKAYADSRVINNVIYITDKESILKFYKEIADGPKFIFIYEKNLRLKSIDILNAPAFFNN